MSPPTAVDDASAEPGPEAPLRRVSRRAVGLSVVIATVAALAAAVVAGALLSGDDRGPQFELERAERVPDVAVERLDGEGTLHFADFEGAPLVVNFFSSTCVPCRTEMPALQEVSNELGDKVTFVGVAVRDDADAARELVADTGVTYLTASDPTSEVFNVFDGTVLPVTAFVDPTGTIMSVDYGKLDADELRDKISTQLLAGG